MQKLSHQTHSFDEYTLDLTRGCLLRGAAEIKLRPKAFEVLSYLVENNGRLVGKEELIKAVWPDSFVTDDSLVQCLMEVRRALGDEAQQIIKTVPRRGYIFDKEVSDNGSAQGTTYTEETTGVQVIIEEEETNGHGDAVTRGRGDAMADLLTQSKVWFLSAAVEQLRWRTALGVLTLAVVAVAIVYFTRPAEAIDSVAVMPFVNVSADANTDYLSDGLSDSIINSLSQLPNLKKVIALNSVLRYKGKQIDLEIVGRELNVRAVLMGRLTQNGDDLSISTELVDVRDNRRLWGGQYNRKLSDITALPTEIAHEISEKLRLRLTGEEKKRLTKRYTQSGEAYQLYMMGRSHSRTRSEKGLQKSIELFEQAIKKDPNYAPAYAGLAETYGFTLLLPSKEARQKEEWASLKALEIDNELAEAHAAMAHLRALDLNWSASEQEGKRALELNPNSVEVLTINADHLGVLGRLDEAMVLLKRAQELDPLSLITGTLIGWVSYLSRQYDRAIEQFQKMIEMDPNFAPAHTRLGWTYLAKGMYEEAIAEHKKANALNERLIRAAAIGNAYAVAGKRDEAQNILDELKQLSKQRYVSPFNFALIYVGLGDKDAAFELLEKTCEERPDRLQFIKLDPRYDNLRSDPRFTDLLRCMKLAP